MDTRIAQVEVIVYKVINNEPLFLLVKRIPEKGGFWQPITGGMHKNENLADAAKRELMEETQISAYKNFIGDVHYFEFNTEENKLLKEYVFGVEVDKNTDARLSYEHSEKKWCQLNEALLLLKYKSNKDAFKKLYKILIAKDNLSG